MHISHPDRDRIDLATVLAVLGDPTRLAILVQLARNEGGAQPCGAFGDLGSKTGLSYHFAKMRVAGVTRTEAVGTNRLVSLRRDDLDALFPGLIDSILAAAGELPAASSAPARRLEAHAGASD